VGRLTPGPRCHRSSVRTLMRGGPAPKSRAHCRSALPELEGDSLYGVRCVLLQESPTAARLRPVRQMLRAERSREERANPGERVVRGFEERVVAQLGQGNNLEVRNVFSEDVSAGSGSSVAFAEHDQYRT
jgi:hypothetical protein